MCCWHLGPPGPRCESPRITGPKSDGLARHITWGERKREGERDQTKHVLDISAPSICLAEDYPQLSAPVSRRKRGPAGSFELDDGRIHQVTWPAFWKGLKGHICLVGSHFPQGSPKDEGWIWGAIEEQGSLQDDCSYCSGVHLLPPWRFGSLRLYINFSDSFPSHREQSWDAGKDS